MHKKSDIITVGFSPAWDITCRVRGIEWGQHKLIASYDESPAGKALNVSRALAWLGQKSTAAGLWGIQDYNQMNQALRYLRKMVDIKLTVVCGDTRKNITVVDTLSNREIHLRTISQLASTGSLRRLKSDLGSVVKENSICVFSGSMPQDGFLKDVIGIIKFCCDRGAKIVVDTSGPALRKIFDSGYVWAIKPNIQELKDLLGKRISDKTSDLVKYGKVLLGKVDIVLISRGKRGALSVTKKGILQGWCTNRPKKVVSTVACGDYLLAGFLKGMINKFDTGISLKTGLAAATARAFGLSDSLPWYKVQKKIKVKVEKI